MPPSRSNARLPLGFAVAALAMLVLLGLGVAAVRVLHRGEVMPGTRVAGLELGGQSEGDALALLRAHANRPVVLDLDGRRTSLRLPRAGVALDPRATLGRALDAGRDGPLAGAWSTLRSVFATRDVAPVVRVDAERLDRAVAAVASRAGRRARNGELRIDPDTLEVAFDRPRDGRSVDRERLRRDLHRAARDATTAVPVSLRRLPAASVKEVRRVAAAARRYLRRPVRVRAGRRTTTIAPARIAAALRVSGGEGGVRLGTSAAVLQAIAGEVAARVNRPARPPRFSASGGTTFDLKGDASWTPRRARVEVQPGRSGLEVDRAAAAAALASAVRADRHDVLFPTRRTKPAVSARAARRVRFLIGTFTTRYEPGQPRVRNIQRIARSADGTVVPPGGTFSLNEISGPRTAAKGYVKAPFIAEGRIVPSIGGGVSQFSTTVYNAAYFAGLRLDSSQPHSLFIDRYPPGREATLNFPDIDLRWTNDTDAPVVVRAQAGASSVTVSLYGDNDRRRVRAEAGPRQPAPGRDFAIEVTRVVRYADGTEVRQPRTTTYDNPVEE